MNVQMNNEQSKMLWLIIDLFLINSLMNEKIPTNEWEFTLVLASFLNLGYVWTYAFVDVCMHVCCLLSKD